MELLFRKWIDGTATRTKWSRSYDSPVTAAWSQRTQCRKICIIRPVVGQEFSR